VVIWSHASTSSKPGPASRAYCHGVPVKRESEPLSTVSLLAHTVLQLGQGGTAKLDQVPCIQETGPVALVLPSSREGRGFP
jgi:hypothetical protein